MRRAQADYYFHKEDYTHAAEWMRVCGVMVRLYALTQLSLEEIALQFMDKGARGALKVYLLKKLDEVPAKKKAQRTLLCTWLTEIYLDEINGMSVGPATASHS